jgi:hypothetical protein
MLGGKPAGAPTYDGGGTLSRAQAVVLSPSSSSGIYIKFESSAPAWPSIAIYSVVEKHNARPGPSIVPLAQAASHTMQSVPSSIITGESDKGAHSYRSCPRVCKYMGEVKVQCPKRVLVLIQNDR